MFKLSYEQLSVEVDKLYSKPFEVSDTSGIEEHCKFIQDFIETCGWTCDNYVARMFAGDSN